MRWLRNLPVSRKFTFAFGIVCGLCMVLGGYSLLTFHRIAQMSGDVSQNNFPSVLALAQIRNAATTLQVMEDSRSAVESGMNETARARQSLEAIIESSKQVEQQIQLIATAATEQTAASGEISESGGQISQRATENTQGAEEAVEALKNLNSLANDLDGMIGQFQLEGSVQQGGNFRGESKPSARSATRSVAARRSAAA